MALLEITVVFEISKILILGPKLLETHLRFLQGNILYGFPKVLLGILRRFRQ